MGEFNYSTVFDYLGYMRDYYGDEFVDRNRLTLEKIYSESRKLRYTGVEYEKFREATDTNDFNPTVDTLHGTGSNCIPTGFRGSIKRRNNEGEKPT